MFPVNYFPSNGAFPMALPAVLAGPAVQPSPCNTVTSPAGALNYSFAKAYKLWPRAESVTLYKFDYSPGGNVVTSLDVAWAHRSVSSLKEKAPTGGSYQEDTLVWRLPLDLLNCLTPLPGDAVVDSLGVPYSILESRLANLTQEYRCTTVDLSLYLPDTVSIERPSYTQDQYKLDQPAWAPAYANISARVQPIAQDQSVEAGQSTETLTVEVVLPQQVAIQSNDRLLWNGSYYAVTEYTRALRITDFPTLKARSTN